MSRCENMPSRTQAARMTAALLDPPAALFRFSRDRGKDHPNTHLATWQGILQADAYGGYNDLYRADRMPGPVGSALCWAHARRKFFELADIAGNVRKGKPARQISPAAFEAESRQIEGDNLEGVDCRGRSIAAHFNDEVQTIRVRLATVDRSPCVQSKEVRWPS